MLDPGEGRAGVTEVGSAGPRSVTRAAFSSADPVPLVSASSPGFAPLSAEPLVFVLAGTALVVAMLALGADDRRLSSTSVVYLLFGIAVAVVVEVAGVRWLDPVRDAAVLEHASELAVIVALFGTGLALERRIGWRSWSSSWRLLGIVMPLSILGLALWAHLAMGLSAAAAIVLAAALAPTDPVLAGAVGVGPPGEEDDDGPRFALTSEAGLNDGLAFPFVMLGLLVASSDGLGRGLGAWLLADVVWAIGVGLLVGAAVGLGLGRLYRRWRDTERVRITADPWMAVAAVLAVYGLTEFLDAYGFIAAFAAGVAFNHTEGLRAGHRGEDVEVDRRIHRGATVAEHVAELALMLLVGSMLSFAGLGLPGAAGWAAVALLLLVLRPVTTMIAFARSGMPVAERRFVAWFGVRGIGSLYYATFAAGTGVLTTGESRKILWTVLLAIAASVLLHGTSAERVLRRMAFAHR